MTNTKHAYVYHSLTGVGDFPDDAKLIRTL